MLRRLFLFFALFLFGYLLAVTLRKEDEAPPVRTELECLEPVGEVAAYGTFRWRYPVPPGGSYELRLYDEGYQLLGSLDGLEEDSWEPGAEQAELLPEALTWEVFARDAEGLDLSSGRAEARLVSEGP